MLGFYIAIIIIGLLLLLLSLYYFVFPCVLIKKIRSGKDQLTYPDDYEKIQNIVTCTKDLCYPSSYSDNTYDLYCPKDKKALGTILWVHGGFFIAGDKRGVENLSTVIASKGFNVIAMNYAVAPKNKYPTAIKQIDEVIKHLSSKKDIDINNLFLGGDSAGGQIVSQYVGLTYNDEYRKSSQITIEGNFKAIKGVVLISAPVNLSSLYGINKKLNCLLKTLGRTYFGFFKQKKGFEECNVIKKVTPNYPPTFITDGNHFSFEKQNRVFGEKLRSLGVETKEIYFDKSVNQVEHEYIFKLNDQLAIDSAYEICEFLIKQS